MERIDHAADEQRQERRQYNDPRAGRHMRADARDGREDHHAAVLDADCISAVVVENRRGTTGHIVLPALGYGNGLLQRALNGCLPRGVLKTG